MQLMIAIHKQNTKNFIPVAKLPFDYTMLNGDRLKLKTKSLLTIRLILLNDIRSCSSGASGITSCASQLQTIFHQNTT